MDHGFMIRALSLVIVFLWLPASPAHADRIVPSDGVTIHLTVRREPSVQSEAVGTLGRNESAELIESVPYWYRIELDDGTPGFVSKRWSRRISEAQESGEIVRLGSWNIKKLGHGSSTDFALVGQIIESNFDVLAVVEVMQKQGGHPGYDTLLSTLGAGWTGMVTDSPRPNTSSGNAEYYAIVYRVAVVRPCAGWTALVFHADHDGGSAGSGADHFSREPAFGCFEAPANDTSVGIDFLLAAYHARWADGDVTLISTEAGRLDEVFAGMQAARPGEKDLFIAGDFNLVPANLQPAVNLPVSTQGAGSTLNSQGQRTTNLYDHILVFDTAETSEAIGNPRVLDVLGVAASPREFFRTISDHLPVVVPLRATGPDDD